MAGTDDPIGNLERLWLDKLARPGPPPFPAWLGRGAHRMAGLVGHPGMYRLNPQLLTAPWAATSVYETALLRDTLTDLVDLDRLNHGGIRVIVGAVDVETALITYFDNAGHDLTLDAVVASGSLPPGFPTTQIDGRHYWDGGLYTNTPVDPAIDFLHSPDPDRPVRELIVVELFPMDAPVPRTLTQVHQRMVQLRFASRARLDRAVADEIEARARLDAAIDAALRSRRLPRKYRAIRDQSDYRELIRPLDVHVKVISAHLEPGLGDATDFSRASIQARIAAGYHDATRNAIADRPDTGPPRLSRPRRRRPGGPATW